MLETFQKNYRTGAFRKWKARGKIDTVTNDVCKECNSGWMRDSEDAARPILRSLMSGKLTLQLSVADQVILREWMFKTAMMIEKANPGSDHFFVAADREAFYKTRRFGKGVATIADIGRYVGKRHGVYSMMYHRPMQFGKDNVPMIELPVYTCTFLMESFLGQLVVVRDARAGLSRATLRLDPRWQMYALPITKPTRAVEWPPVRGVPDEGLGGFVDRFHVRAFDQGQAAAEMIDCEGTDTKR
jgi:hypothetical protein